jgi:hypothetical protein
VRAIGVLPKGHRDYLFGTMIPISHFKPMVEKWMERGVITKISEMDTIQEITELTNKLIPEHTQWPTREYADMVLAHGEHLSPMIAIKLGTGKCSDWAAVFTAIARNAGLDVRISGDPKFFNWSGVEKQDQHHIWPVVITKDGKRIPVHPIRPVRGAPEERVREEYEQADKRVRTGGYPLYTEHKPKIPVVIPPELKVGFEE